MKLFTFLLLIITVNCSAQSNRTYQDSLERLKKTENNTIEFHEKTDSILHLMKTTFRSLIYYDVYISSPEKGRVAYKKRDSAWVITDSAETLKMLLFQMEQQSKLYRRQ